MISQVAVLCRPQFNVITVLKENWTIFLLNHVFVCSGVWSSASPRLKSFPQTGAWHLNDRSITRQLSIQNMETFISCSSLLWPSDADVVSGQSGVRTEAPDAIMSGQRPCVMCWQKLSSGEDFTVENRRK